MKRAFCLIGVLLLTVSMVIPAFASESIFVPSITYKDGLEIVSADMDNQDVKPCLVVTSIAGAKNATTDIFQSDRDQLLDVYSKLNDNSMSLPIDKDYVVRELVDVSFKKSECVEKIHEHKEWLAKDNTVVNITFKLDIDQTQELAVFTYINGEWVPAKSVNNLQNGTVSCVFEDICPVAFCVSEMDPVDSSPDTSDMGVSSSWFVMMITSSMLLFFVIFLWPRNKQEDKDDNKVNTEI